jgi:hypothetical protein
VVRKRQSQQEAKQVSHAVQGNPCLAVAFLRCAIFGARFKNFLAQPTIVNLSG